MLLDFVVEILMLLEFLHELYYLFTENLAHSFHKFIFLPHVQFSYDVLNIPETLIGNCSLNKKKFYEENLCDKP